MSRKGENIPLKSTGKSKLRSEAGEADWYATPDGRRQTEREFVRALKSNSLIRSAGLKVTKTNPLVLQQRMEQSPGACN